jgi:multiple sugar transport system permease protein
VTFFKNTAFLSVVITLIQLFTSSFAAYGFSKLNFKGRDILFLAYIGTIAVPWQSYMIPQFIMMRKVGLTDTLWSLVLLQAFNAFGVFLLKQYYSSIPDFLCESARIDGLSEWGIYRKIILPLTKPAIASLTIITFVNTWNDYMGPFIYLSSTENKTIQLGLKMFIGLFDAEYALNHGCLSCFCSSCCFYIFSDAKIFCRRDRFIRNEGIGGDYERAAF